MALADTYFRDTIAAHNCDLFTERLKLTPVQAHHEPYFWEMFSNEDVVRYLPYELATDRETHSKSFNTDLKCGLRFKFGFAVEMRDREDEAVGWCIARPTEDGKNIELGYIIHISSWGKGLATEITQRLVRFCVEDKKWPQEDLMAIATTKNPASRRVLEKSGFIVEKEIDDKDGRCWQFKYSSAE